MFFLLTLLKKIKAAVSNQAFKPSSASRETPVTSPRSLTFPLPHAAEAAVEGAEWDVPARTDSEV